MVVVLTILKFLTSSGNLGSFECRWEFVLPFWSKSGFQMFLVFRCLLYLISTIFSTMIQFCVSRLYVFYVSFFSLSVSFPSMFATFYPSVYHPIFDANYQNGVSTLVSYSPLSFQLTQNFPLRILRNAFTISWGSKSEHRI